jgi:predicted DNA-binding protein YlxM (UPF0122 family)
VGHTELTGIAEKIDTSRPVVHNAIRPCVLLLAVAGPYATA